VLFRLKWHRDLLSLRLAGDGRLLLGALVKLRLVMVRGILFSIGYLGLPHKSNGMFVVGESQLYHQLQDNNH
jgi:hypothetical protein